MHFGRFHLIRPGIEKNPEVVGSPRVLELPPNTPVTRVAYGYACVCFCVRRWQRHASRVHGDRRGALGGCQSRARGTPSSRTAGADWPDVTLRRLSLTLQRAAASLSRLRALSYANEVARAATRPKVWENSTHTCTADLLTCVKILTCKIAWVMGRLDSSDTKTYLSHPGEPSVGK